MSLFFRLLFKIETNYSEWKRARLKRYLKACGRNFSLDDGAHIWSPELMEVGDDCCLRGYSYVYAGGGIVLGDRVRIAANCVITSVSHEMVRPAPQQWRSAIYTPVEIQDDVWIGANVVVCAGVKIGAGSIIGAGSVVTKDIPAGVFAAGVPAQVLRPV